MNEQINFSEVRLVGSDGAQLGIVSGEKAKQLAEEAGLDLVLIAQTATPPVCKIMDYGKFKFEQSKKQKEARKNQKVVEIKEIRLSGRYSKNLAIGEHDLQFKAKNAIKFLEAGNKIKLSIMLKGRQVANSELGIEIINKFIEMILEAGVVEKAAKVEGRFITAIVAPKKK